MSARRESRKTCLFHFFSQSMGRRRYRYIVKIYHFPIYTVYKLWRKKKKKMSMKFLWFENAFTHSLVRSSDCRECRMFEYSHGCVRVCLTVFVVRWLYAQDYKFLMINVNGLPSSNSSNSICFCISFHFISFSHAFYRKTQRFFIRTQSASKQNKSKQNKNNKNIKQIAEREKMWL